MNTKSRFSNLSMFAFMFQRFPLFVICESVFQILTALTSYVGNVLFLQYIVTAMIEHRTFQEMLLALAIFAIYQIITDIYSAVYLNILKPHINERIQKHFYKDIQLVADSCELYTYDNPSFYDNMTYVSEHIFDDATASVSYVSKLLSSLVNILLIVSLFFRIGFCVLIIVCVSIAVSIVFDIPIIRLNNKKKYEMTSANRKKYYFYNCFFSRGSFMDRKKTGLDDILERRYLSAVEEQKQCNRKYGLKIFFLTTFKNGLYSDILLSLILLSYLLYETLITKNLNGADFIAAYNAVNIIVSSIMGVIFVWENMKSSAYTIDIYYSLRTRVKNKIPFRIEDDRDKLHGTIKEIELKNVSFSYPGTSIPVINQINMKFSLGDKIAIVGKNGSGKTTLVHILMGLYEPTSGEICVNGKTVAREDYPIYRRQFAAFFQGMMPFEASIAENVALDTNVDQGRVKEALLMTDSSNLLARAPNERIGILFDKNGLILSGGEFQKLMLSYCFYSKKLLIVMDEPTSALSPLAEKNFNRQVVNISDGKLAIFVSHRLSTVLLADYIYVLDCGKIIDCGSHQELLEHNGVYKDMWDIQVGKYK